jgi:gas vesicle protein
MNQDRNNISDHITTRATAPNYRSGLGYLLVGGGIGAILALLFAPKAGRQFRGDIADVTRRGYDAAAVKAKDIKATSGDLANTLKEKAEGVYDFAARKVGSGVGSEHETSEKAIGDVTSATEKLASAATDTQNNPGASKSANANRS